MSASAAAQQPDAGAAAAGAGSQNCGELERIAALANSPRKFSGIAGPTRGGDFSNTTVPLKGWADCSVYGIRTYSCDSPPFKTAAAVEQAIERVATEIAACPGAAWQRRPQQSSSAYQILAYIRSPVSMTLSTAQSDDGFLLRLIMFTRRD